MNFEFFDPTQEVYVHYRRLPHREQPGVMASSPGGRSIRFPQATLRRWRVERAGWLRRHESIRGPRTGASFCGCCRPPTPDYHMHFTDAWMKTLDQCHGACVLKPPASQSSSRTCCTSTANGMFFPTSSSCPIMSTCCAVSRGGTTKARCPGLEALHGRRINERLRARAILAGRELRPPGAQRRAV